MNEYLTLWSIAAIPSEVRIPAVCVSYISTRIICVSRFGPKLILVHYFDDVNDNPSALALEDF